VKLLAFCVAIALPALADVKLNKQADRIEVAIDGKPFTTFYFGPETHKPYLHPLRTADGTVVTRSYPMEMVEGETRDHPHHQGVWFTHGDVNGFDFWANSKLTAKQGKVVLDKIRRVQGGDKTGIIEADFNWNDPTGKTLLKEHRRMTFYAEPDTRTVDFDITLTAVGEPVKFGDTKEGTFAIRIHDKMTEKAKGGMMTSSSGAQGMRQVWGKPFPWVDYSGTVEGKQVGLTIFDHPANPKHPTHWHSRDYGLFAANIFGEHDFYSDKTRDGSVTLEPGKSMRFRYRVVVHSGGTDPARSEDLFSRYRKANFK
jgi:hypothetical protein